MLFNSKAEIIYILPNLNFSFFTQKNIKENYLHLIIAFNKREHFAN